MRGGCPTISASEASPNLAVVAGRTLFINDYKQDGRMIGHDQDSEAPVSGVRYAGMAQEFQTPP